MDSASPSSLLRRKSQSKKRKQRSTDVVGEARESSKSARFDESTVGEEERSPWKNLQLILSLQDKNVDILKNIDLAFDYTKSSNSEEMGDIDQRSQVLDSSRTIAFLNNWIQSILISSEKKIKHVEDTAQFEASGSVMDLRCWKVFQFCLKESQNLHISLTCSRDFLRVIHSIARDASSFLNNMSSSVEETLSGEKLQIYDTVLDCVSMVFSFHGGVANKNLDLWILLMDTVLNSALKTVTGQLDGTKVGNFIMLLASYLFEPFAKFLSAQPTRKNGFRSFIDKLLEPLLHFLHIMHSKPCGSDNEWKVSLRKWVEEVLAQGLFHPSHIEEYLSLKSSVRYESSSDVTIKDEELEIRSYHRHLFDEVEKIVARKNESALIGLAKLLHLFCCSVMKQNGISVSNGEPTPKVTPTSRFKDAELRRSIFDFYIPIMEYQLVDINKYLQSEGSVGSVLYNVFSTLGSINSLLAGIICNKLYLRTEDACSQGNIQADSNPTAPPSPMSKERKKKKRTKDPSKAFRNFLRSIHAVLMSLSAKIETTSFGYDEKSNKEALVSVRTELIVSVHHLLNIEYEVVGDDLESLWTMIFSSAACCYSSEDIPSQPLLSSEILNLSCRLIDVYSDLRQVDCAIFALCRAVRRSLLLPRDCEEYSPTGSCSTYSNSFSILFCSSKFKLSLSNAVKSIPEGQASACLRQLCSDIKESLEWMRFGDQSAGTGEPVESNHLRAELVGKVLCEAYAVILDSTTVTSGNSCSIGASLKSSIEIIRSSFGRLVTLRPDGGLELSVLVDGRVLSKSTGPDNVTLCWILVLFLRLLLSCRSLFRQVVSLMPPDASKKMSAVISDSLTVQCGRDWLEMTAFADEGFLSWISQPSVVLLDVINSISDICIENYAVLCPPLVYILNAMALQRLADLNRLIKSSEYMLQWNESMDQTKLKDDADLSSNRKRIRKWRKCVAEMRKEAEGLTEFMVECLPSAVKNKKSSSLVDDEIVGTHALLDNTAPNIPVGFLNEKSLTPTLWWMISKDVDIWCSHANKKHLKNILTHIIQASLSCLVNNDCSFLEHDMNTTGHRKTGTAPRIALEFLSNIIFYELRFVRRYMASRFCTLLQKSVLSIFNTSAVDMSGSPDWLEAVAAVGNTSDVKTGTSPQTKRNMIPSESSNKQLNVEIARCQCLLHLLMQLPNEYLSLESSSLYITYILNFERLLVGSLLGWNSAKWSLSSYQIFRLLVTCRKALQILALASSKDNTNGSKSPLCLFPLPWLLKSLPVAIEIQHAFAKDLAFETRAALISYLDSTSHVFLMVTKNHHECAISYAVSRKIAHAKRKNADEINEQSDLSGCEASVACQSILEVAKTLEDDLKKSFTTVREASIKSKTETMAGSQDLNKLSSILACFQGLLWGLASCIGDKRAVNSNSRMNSSRNDVELMTRINSCVDAYMVFAITFVKEVFTEDNPALDMSTHSDELIARASSGQSGFPRDGTNEGCLTGKILPSDINGGPTKCENKKKSCLSFPDLEALLTEVQDPKLHLKKSLLMQAFRGENAEVAYFLRQLFLACSAILRLNLQVEFTSLSWSFFPIVVDISEFMLLEFSRNGLPNQFTLFLLDGVVRFLEELGNYFPHIDPSLSKDFYVKLIVLHQKAIGKCICLQGKEAKLTSQERGSLTKLAGQVQSQFSRERSRLVELKERLSMSFNTCIRKSSEFYLLSIIQAVERALVGVWEGSVTNYEIVCGSLNGGKVSSVVAAGIVCLDSILELVTGPGRLNMLKKHIKNLVAGLFNIILHLQGPGIFYGYLDSKMDSDGPDSGAVTLMCIELLTKISGKPSFFEIVACHNTQCLRVPGSLFQYFLQLVMSESPVKAAMDRKASMELYDACCRMLCTALKHHKSETRQCIALLQDSVSVLLHCLETVNTDHISGRATFAWGIHEAVICAGSLRRVYEEVRQQKDVFGQFSSQFLSRYIWVYCGFGPAKTGIIREVDKALRPGVYALIDSCSDDDLQLLHTTFGEGPCRSTLASLQHDYQVDFQFEGKV